MKIAKRTTNLSVRKLLLSRPMKTSRAAARVESRVAKFSVFDSNPYRRPLEYDGFIFDMVDAALLSKGGDDDCGNAHANSPAVTAHGGTT